MCRSADKGSWRARARQGHSLRHIGSIRNRQHHRIVPQHSKHHAWLAHEPGTSSCSKKLISLHDHCTEMSTGRQVNRNTYSHDNQAPYSFRTGTFCSNLRRHTLSAQIMRVSEQCTKQTYAAFGPMRTKHCDASILTVVRCRPTELPIWCAALHHGCTSCTCRQRRNEVACNAFARPCDTKVQVFNSGKLT